MGKPSLQNAGLHTLTAASISTLQVVDVLDVFISL
jgi:hypothetical protein